MGSQCASPHVWMAVGGILFILGLVPAMPQMLILPAAAIALGAGWQMRRMAAIAVPAEEPAVPAADTHHLAWADVSDASACQLEAGYAQIALVDERKGEHRRGRITGKLHTSSKELGRDVRGG